MNPEEGAEKALAVENASVSFSQENDPTFFLSRHLPLPGVFGPPRTILKSSQVVRVVQLPPLVECFGNDTEVSAGLGYGMTLVMVVHPLEALSGLF